MSKRNLFQICNLIKNLKLFYLKLIICLNMISSNFEFYSIYSIIKSLDSDLLKSLYERFKGLINLFLIKIELIFTKNYYLIYCLINLM